MTANKSALVIASWVSLLGNAFLAIIKLFVGFISGSFAVIADGIDSTADIISSIVTLVAARIVSKPPNIRYSYGYIKADTVATKVLSMLIFLAGAQLGIATVKRLINNPPSEAPSVIAIYVTIFSIIGKILLSLYLRHTGKVKVNNTLVTMGINMRNDMLISFTVLISLITSIYLKIGIIDVVIGMLISAFIMYEAIRIFLKSNIDLMDGIDDPDLYNRIFCAIKKVEGASNPHRARARKIGSHFMINLDVEVDPDLTVKDAHDIAINVEKTIKQDIANVYDVMVHIEPKGNEEKYEKFGITENHITENKKKKKS